MPITTSAKKAVRQTVKKTAVNAYFKKSMKNNTKLANKTIEKEDKKEITKTVQSAQKSIDKAAKRNIISKKSAARKISSLMKKTTK